MIDGLGGPGGHATEDGSELTTSEVNDIRTSGMTCLHLTVGEVGTMLPDEAYQKAVALIARWEAEVDRYPATVVRVRSVADIHAAKWSGRTGPITVSRMGCASRLTSTGSRRFIGSASG